MAQLILGCNMLIITIRGDIILLLYLSSLIGHSQAVVETRTIYFMGQLKGDLVLLKTRIMHIGLVFEIPSKIVVLQGRVRDVGTRCCDFRVR